MGKKAVQRKEVGAFLGEGNDAKVEPPPQRANSGFLSVIKEKGTYKGLGFARSSWGCTFRSNRDSKKEKT